MRSSDFIKMGLKNLTRRKLRTSLTILGVVIGTFSIVIMLSLNIFLSLLILSAVSLLINESTNFLSLS